MRLRQNRRGRAERERNGGNGRARHADAEQAPREAEEDHLQHVNRDDLPAPRADALQDRDAANLLEDEHTGYARHRDAAEDHDHQPDETQIILGAIEIAADLILGRSKRAGVDEFFSEVGAKIPDQRLRLFRGHFDEDDSACAAAVAQETGRRQIGGVDQHARAEAELAGAAARLARDDTADRERRESDRDPIMFADAERREQFRPHEHTVILHERMRVRLPAAQLDRSVERKRRLDCAQFHHLRHLARPIRRPHHRRHLDRFGPAGGARLGKPPVDRRARLGCPVAVRRDQHVGRDQRSGFPADHLPHALDHRPQRDNRRDADGNTDEEEQKPPPRRPSLPRRHPQDEHHWRASIG